MPGSEAGFTALTRCYGWAVRKTVGTPGIMLALTTATFVINSLLYCNKTKDSFTTEDNGLITSTTVGPDDASFNAGVARQNALAKVVRQNPDVITMIHVEGRRQCAGLDPELGPHVHRPPLRNFGPSTLM
ncbi:hypothetical protein CaCOL14_013175 [Colletotrichum acutatum]